MESIKVTDTSQNFTITESAAERIATLISDEADKNSRLRISVTGGGCSGFQYNYDFVSDETSDDSVFEKNGIKVLIDSVSMEFMNECVLDYVETLGSASFEIKNPNATAKCGCGNSFSV